MASNSESVKKIVSAAIAALLGGGGQGGSFGSVGGAGGEGLGKTSGGFNPFLIPVSTGESLTHNLVGKETPQAGAHEQTLDEHTANMRKLVNEYYQNNPLPKGLTGNALRSAASIQALRAMEYAINEEPNRDFGYITSEMNGVKPDSRPRTVNGRTFNASSSWVGAVRRTSPTEVQVYLGPSANNSSGWYTYGGNARDVERFLTCDSLGTTVGKLARLEPGATLNGLRKLY